MAQTKCVGLVVRPTRTYCRRIVDGIVTVGVQAGWEHILVPTDVPAALGGFCTGLIDGFIGYFSDQLLLKQVRKTAIPAVDLSSELRESPLPRVATDEIAVGRLAATYLLSLGLPRFGFIGSAGEYPSIARLRGFQDTLKAAGQTCHSFLEPTGTKSEANPQRTNDFPAWVRKLQKPIGVFASSDILGLQFLAICKKLNIAVPKEAAILGVGNDDLLCRISNPPLTSIALPTQRIGFDGAKLLALLMDGKTLPQKTILIPPAGVIPRQSSALLSILDPDVAAAVSYIALHAKDHLSVIDVLRNVQVSRASLDQRFMKVLGRTPASEIRRAQIDLAKTVLSETQEQMPQVAVAAGFLNAKQLTATFHHEVGITPTAYRRQFQIRTISRKRIGVLSV
jgi:LacI family transcriptional regulator